MRRKPGPGLTVNGERETKGEKKIPQKIKRIALQKPVDICIYLWYGKYKGGKRNANL
jgi:hypothetical protein